MAMLREEDRRAVDLFLDRAAAGPAKGDGNGQGNGSASTNGNGNGDGHAATGAAAGFTQVSDSGQSRVPAVQKLFEVLDMLPAEEPPADLMVRTLRRLDEAAGNHPAALRPPQHVMGGVHMPHA